MKIWNQTEELFPTYDCDLLFTPYESSTNEDDSINSGGSYYWYYIEVRKGLRAAGFIPPKKSKDKPSQVTAISPSTIGKARIPFFLFLYSLIRSSSEIFYLIDLHLSKSSIIWVELFEKKERVEK